MSRSTAERIPFPKYSVPEIASMYRAIKEKPIRKVAEEFGVLEYYKGNTQKADAYIYQKVYRDVSKNNDKYGVAQDVVDEVMKAVGSRGIIQKQNQQVFANKNEEATNIVISLRDKALKLAHLKLDRIMRSNKSVDEANLSTIFTALGISFDKAQVIQGQATENIAMIAKINKDMSPEDAMQAILNVREENQARSDRTSKK